MLHYVALVVHALVLHHGVGREDAPLAVLAALGGEAVQHPEHLSQGPVTVLTRAGHAGVLHAAHAGDVGLALLVPSTWYIWYPVVSATQYTWYPVYLVPRISFTW